MTDVRWEGLTHAEIYARVQQGPGRLASTDAEAAWNAAWGTIRAVDEQLTRAVKQIGVDWQGPAADSARGGMSVMSSWAVDAAHNALQTRAGITAQAVAADYVRNAMPPPRHELDTAVALVGAGGYAPRAVDVGALEDRMAEDHALAVDLMNGYTRDSATNQQLMNHWTQPPSVVVEAVAPAPTPGRPGVPVGRTAGAVVGLAPAGAAGRGQGAAGSVGSAHEASRSDPASGPPGAAGTGGPIIGRAGVPGPAPPVPGPAASTTSGTAPGAPAPPDRAQPGLTVVPGTGPDRPVGLPATSRSPRSGLREPPPGGVRQVVPRVPGRSGPLDAPWNAPSGRPTDGIAGGRGVAEPVPQTGRPGEVPSGTEPRETAVRAETGVRAIAGGPAEDAVLGRTVPQPAERAAGSGHGILPFGGAARSADQEHRRPGYLVDDTDAFADDRWFPPPVIVGDDPEARRA